MYQTTTLSPTHRPQLAAISTGLTHVSIDDLEDQITELAGHLNAADYRWLTLIAEFVALRPFAHRRADALAPSAFPRKRQGE